MTARLAACALLVAFAPALHLHAAEGYAVEETRLATYPRGEAMEWRCADCLHVGWTVRGDGGQCAVVDGRPGPLYDAIGPMLCTPDGAHRAYSAQRGGRWTVVLDGREGPWYDGIGPVFSPPPLSLARLEPPTVTYEGAFVLSPDGRRVAFEIRRGQRSVAVVAGEEGPEFGRIGPIEFSPGGQHVAYAGIAPDGTETLVVDGRAGPRYDHTSQVTYSPDGSRVAYVGSRGGAYMVVVDGVESAPYIGIGTIVFSPDSRGVGYPAWTGPQAAVAVADGHVSAVYEDVGPVVFSPDSRRMAYRALTGGKEVAVVDGEPGPAFDPHMEPRGSLSFRGGFLPTGTAHLAPAAGSIAFSGDSGHVAYVAHRGETAFVVVDGAEGPPFETIAGEPVLSHNGRHVAYVGTRGGQRVGDRWQGGSQALVLDGQAGPLYPEITYLQCSPDLAHTAYIGGGQGRWAAVVDQRELAAGKRWVRVVLSPDGGRAGYVLQREDGFVVVVDGVEAGPYEQVWGPVFSADGQHVAYTTLTAQEGHVVVDGVPGPVYEWVAPHVPPVLRADGGLEYLGAREGTVYRVRHTPIGTPAEGNP